MELSRLNSVNRCVIQIAAFLLFLFVSTSNTYVVSLLNNEDSNSVPGAVNSTCTTDTCKNAAALLISAMNTSVDPCEDFYQYACGGWIAKNEIPSSQSSWATFNVLAQQVSFSISNILSDKNDLDDPNPVSQARDFYAACMNSTLLETIGLQPLVELITSFGGWPMTIKDWKENSFSWQKVTASITRLYSTGVLLNVKNSLDGKNSSRNVIQIDQANFILSTTELVNASSAKNNIAAYTDFITGAARAIRDVLKSEVVYSQIDIDVRDMLEFEYSLANITTPKEDRRNSTRMYNPLSLTELQMLTDMVNTTTNHAKVNWLQYLNNIYKLGAGITITSSERVVVVEIDYLKVCMQRLVGLLDKTPLRTIANYVHWNLVYKLASATDQRMKDLLFQFKKVTRGTKEPTPLNITCANAANNYLGFAISYKYVASKFDEKAKNDTMVMITNLKTAFKSLVDDATWMDSATKSIAKSKADFMASNIGYPDWMTNKTALKSYYTSLSTSRTDYFGSFQNASSFLNAQSFKMLRGLTDRNFWQMFPNVVNAMYDPTYNAITFPAAVLQLPFYERGRLAALNYGGIGAIIGHEITHGFDDHGRQSDQYGNVADWWTNNTVTNYLSRAKCFIDQYSNYTTPSGAHLNAVNTQGENIADNGGVREAFRAYKLYVAANGIEPKLPGLEEFTSEQLFFLSYANNWCSNQTPQYLQNLVLADSHSPNNFRVLGPLSNNEDFVNQFKCPASSVMNRSNKCILW